MGNKTHPVGFRLGIVKDWQSKWITSRPGDYKKLVGEDLDMRKSILSTHPDAAISDIYIERHIELIVQNLGKFFKKKKLINKAF